MAIETKIYPELKLVYTITKGTVVDQDMIDHENWLKKQNEFKPDFSQLVDAREVTENKISVHGLIETAKISPFSTTSKRAYVVKDLLSTGFSSLFGNYSSEDSKYFFVTSDINEAVSWLELEELPS